MDYELCSLKPLIYIALVVVLEMVTLNENFNLIDIERGLPHTCLLNNPIIRNLLRILNSNKCLSSNFSSSSILKKKLLCGLLRIWGFLIPIIVCRLS